MIQIPPGDTCLHCGEATDEQFCLRKKWVSWGPAPEYRDPTTGKHNCFVALHKACRDAFLSERAKWFAVLDETMNTDANFRRLSGQRGEHVCPRTGKVTPCKGWQSASEIGVEYEVADRYRDYL